MHQGADKIVFFPQMPSRRLEDRIRELCDQLIVAEPDEVGSLVEQLRSALREHVQRLRGFPAGEQQRRQA